MMGPNGWRYLLVLGLLLTGCHLGVLDGSKRNALDYKFPAAGEIAECEGKTTDYQITWTPKRVSFGDTISYNVRIVPGSDLSGGTVNVTVFVEGVPNPVYKAVAKFTCADIHVYVPNPEICPFYKGRAVKLVGNYVLKASTPLPVGRYSVRAEVFDQNNARFGCLVGSFDLVDE